MNSLQEQKLKLEKELERINKQLDQGSEIERNMKLISTKIDQVKELFPSINLEIYENSDMNTPYANIKEYAIDNQYHSHTHEIDFNDIEKSLSIFNDVLNNQNKYKERINIANKLIDELSCKHWTPYIYTIAGIITHDIVEEIKTSHGLVHEEIIINGKFNDQNNLDLQFCIGYSLDNDLSNECNVELNGFNFKIETLFRADGYDSLEANNDYICTLENVKVDELSQTIKKLKDVTRNHSLLINFDKIISKTM